MTSEEIAKRIMDKFHSVTKQDLEVKNQNGHAQDSMPKLIFEISNKPPINTEGVLDSFELTKVQMLDVIAICTNDPEEENKEEIADIIVKDKVDEKQPMYLVALYKYVTKS